MTLSHDNSSSLEIATFLKKLSYEVSRGCSTSDSVNQIADFYQSPVSLLDNAYRFIAACTNYPVIDEVLNHEIQNGYLENGFHFLRSIDFLNPTLKKPKHNYYDLAEDIHYKRHHYSLIFAGSIPIAAISVFEGNDQQISEEKLDALVDISCILSMQLQIINTQNIQRDFDINHLLSMILGDLPFEPSLMTERFALLGYPVKKNQYLIAAEYKDSSAGIDQGKLNGIGNYLKGIFPNSMYMLLDRRIILFFSMEQPISDLELTEWQRVLSHVDIRLGISNVFCELKEAKNHLPEAINVLDLGLINHPDENLYFYDQYQLDYIAHRLALEKDITPYIYPPVLDLLAYDKANKGCLIPTLKAYIKETSRPQDVCKKLFIHKNTLYYRLDKIKTMIPDSLDNAEVTAKILLTLKILEYHSHSGFLSSSCSDLTV